MPDAVKRVCSSVLIKKRFSEIWICEQFGNQGFEACHFEPPAASRLEAEIKLLGQIKLPGVNDDLYIPKVISRQAKRNPK